MSGMLKAGLIGLVVGGLFGLGATIMSPVCTPCGAIFVGLGAGFLAAMWDKPLTRGGSAGLGAKAGAIAGVGHLIGQILGMVANMILVGPEQAAQIASQLGLDAQVMTQSQYLVSQILINGSCGVINIGIAAGLGALGGLLWYQTMGKNQVSPMQQPPVY